MKPLLLFLATIFAGLPAPEATSPVLVRWSDGPDVLRHEVVYWPSKLVNDETCLIPEGWRPNDRRVNVQLPIARFVDYRDPPADELWMDQ